MKIFWSWQNDYAPNLCRHFIRSALVEAITAVGTELGLDDSDRPEIDHDTKDVPGMVEITNTILDKISESAVFVADLTPIGESDKEKALPNPNVLIELGWALSKVGPDRIIAVLNTASGYEPDDLPFDIRHRRALTYELADTATKSERDSARRALTRALVGALRANLGKHLEDKAAAQDIVGIPANPSDPSIWASASGQLQHTDPFGANHTQVVDFPACARGYIRVIPAGWKSGPPTISEIQRVDDDKIVWPRAEGTNSGDFGPCEEGFVRYWITRLGRDGRRETRNVAMYFDNTGEFWVLHGTALDEERGRVLHINSLLEGWAKAMGSAIALQTALGAYPTRKIEAGIVGIQGARWPGNFNYQSPPARKGSCLFTRQLRDWNPEVQLQFLADAYNRVRDVFGLNKVAIDDVRRIVAS